MEWWNDTRMLVARYLVASEQMERDGPVAQAVRSVGYLSEDEDEGEDDDEDGSSVEEDAEESHEHHHEHNDHAEPEGLGARVTTEGEGEGAPAYTKPEHGVEVGENGYAVSYG